MARILSKNTKPEKTVRHLLTSLGFRYRLHVKKLPGKPDIVLPKYGAVILVHGCFWHLHSKCRDGTIPKSRTNYWREKLLNNKKRDTKNIRELRKQGWRVLRIWECEIEGDPNKVAEQIQKFMSSG